ncbi:MAG: hypothetical protein FWC39_02695 [Bacteroidetes bacterium]|nr:hypothetical protein [Bacteroidota bacterium]
MKKFIPFRSFSTEQEAQQFVEFIEQMGIAYELEEYQKNVLPAFLSNVSNNDREILIKLRGEDFDKANEFVLHDDEISGIETSAYLNNFTDEELIEILVQPHEWGIVDRTLAPKILTERGYNIHALDIENRKKQYIAQLTEPKKASLVIIILGYVLALFGITIGLIIGWVLLSKKTLPNREKVYIYDKKSRMHGTIIVAISICWLIVIIIGVIFSVVIGL